jgi:hypothetical protein
MDLENLHETVTRGFAELGTRFALGLGSLAGRVDEHQRALQGNGQPGLIKDVKGVQEQLAAHVQTSDKRLGRAWAVALMLAGATTTWLLGSARELLRPRPAPAISREIEVPHAAATERSGLAGTLRPLGSGR